MHLLAIGGLFYISISAIILFIVFHLIFVLFGISLGLHKLFSHRHYIANNRLYFIFVSIIATLCFQGSPIFWAAAHRAHHRSTEEVGDPHSAKRGFLWSHVLWMCYLNPNGFRYIRERRHVKDLVKNPLLKWLEVNAIKLNVGLLIFTFCIGFLTNRLDLFFWLMPIRIVSVWHATWLTNSVSHKAFPFVKRQNTNQPQYLNSRIMSLILGGEGFHKTHHDNMRLAVYGGWRTLDFSGWILLAFSKVGLVSINKSPS